MKKLKLSPNLNRHFEWEFLASSFPNAGMSIVKRYYDVGGGGGKSFQKWTCLPNDLSLSCKCITFAVSIFFFFLVYFMLCSSWEGIGNTLSTFSNKELNRITISPWKWKLCVNIYTIELKSIHWMRPMEGCFLILRANRTGEKFNLNIQINK